MTKPAESLSLAGLGEDTPSDFLSTRRYFFAHTAEGCPSTFIPSLLVTNVIFSTCTSCWKDAGFFSPWLSQPSSSCSPPSHLGPFFPFVCDGSSDCHYPQKNTPDPNPAPFPLSWSGCCSCVLQDVVFPGSIPCRGGRAVVKHHLRGGRAVVFSGSITCRGGRAGEGGVCCALGRWRHLHCS